MAFFAVSISASFVAFNALNSSTAFCSAFCSAKVSVNILLHLFEASKDLSTLWLVALTTQSRRPLQEGCFSGRHGSCQEIFRLLCFDVFRSGWGKLESPTGPAMPPYDRAPASSRLQWHGQVHQRTQRAEAVTAACRSAGQASTSGW